jgi:hypothetical protein
MRQSLSVFAIGSLLGGAAACSSAGGGDDGPSHEGSDPLYLAMTRVWDDTSTTSYLHLVPSLDAGTEVDVSQALELPGPAKLFAHEKLGWFAVGGGEEPIITRYGLDGDGRLQEGASISLQPFGVQALWDSIYFVSPEKAYYPDTSGSQLVVWNPTTMEVTGTVALPETVRDGYLSYYGIRPLRRGDKLLFSVGWFDWLTNDTVLGETGLVVLDTTDDTVERFDTDARCAGITQVIETESGDAYFVSSAMAGAAHQLGRLATEPCALRVRAGEDAFDADYVASLGELSGEAVVGEPAPGQGNGVLLRALDPALVEVTEETHTWDFTGQAKWRWLSWDVTSDVVTSLSELPAATADAFWFRVDGKVLASQTNSEYTLTELVDLSDPTAPASAISFPGFLQSVARVR